jgi:Leucine-rich repeat (LRR) protein
VALSHPTLTKDLNDAHGSIPTELAMFNLSSLSLAGNEFTGTIHTGLSHSSLHLEGNQLSGTISSSLFQESPNLSYVRLESNKLTGSLPSEVGLYPREFLSFSANQLSGTLPSELFGLETLEILALNDNKVSLLLRTAQDKFCAKLMLFLLHFR